LDLENLNVNKSKLEEVTKVLIDSFKSYTLNIMAKHNDAFKINFALKELFIKSLVKLLLSDESEAKKLKLVPAPQEYQPDEQPVIMANLLPNYDNENQYDFTTARTKKGRKGIATCRKDTKSTARKSDLDQTGITHEEEKIDIVEVDFDDKGTIFGQNTERGRFFAHNKVGSLVVMREAVILISRLFAELENHEAALLKNAYRKYEKFEQIFKETLQGIPDFQYNLQ